MSEEKNKWIDAAAKMIKLTQDGTLKWEAVKPSVSLKKQSDDTVDIAFQTTYKDKKLRLYKRIYKDYRPVSKPSPTAFTIPQLFGVEREMESYWATEVNLEFLSSEGLTLWTYPKVNILSDLLSAVQYQVAGVKDFLNDLLSDEEQSA